MKATELKKFIKEAVREAIQDELKDILLEAVKTPKQVIRESYTPPSQPTPPPSFTEPTFNARDKYRDIIGETALSFTSRDIQPSFTPHGTDPVNGNLGSGEVSLDQIKGLMR